MTTDEPQAAAPRKRWRFQFSLRALMLFVLLVSLGMSAVVTWVRSMVASAR